MALLALVDEAEIEKRIGVVRVGMQCAFEANQSFVGAASIIEDVGQVVPGFGEARVGHGRHPIGRFRLDLVPDRPQQIAEIECGGGIAGIDPHDLSIKPLRRFEILRLLGRLRLFEQGIRILARFFDRLQRGLEELRRAKRSGAPN